MSKSREDQLADDLYRRARQHAKEAHRDGHTASIKPEIKLVLTADDERVAAGVLEERGIAEVDGDRVTIVVDLTPVGLRGVVDR